MRRIILFSLFTIMFFMSFLATAGKKHCQSYRNKLDNIQAQQRQASSHKRSISLSNKEAKARDKWWRCETGKLKPKSKKKKQKKAKSKSSSKKNNIGPQAAASKKVKSTKPLIPFASNSPVVVRSRYQGEKLQAWLLFYQADKICRRPKSTQQFAACVEDKRRQQIEFEKSY